jgi:sec-independent protein translocase protein TatA
MIGDILQPTHLLFVLVVALLVLGPKRLPEAGRALGRGIRDFRMAISGDDHDRGEITNQTADVATPAPAVAPPTPEATSPPATPAAAPPPSADAPPTAADAPPPPADATADTAHQQTEPAQPVG